MSKLFIDSVNAPSEIKEKLRDLSNDIDFTQETTKGSNGYLFFGKNRILETDVAVKFYYWGGQQKYHAEPSILASINSPNVLSVQTAGLHDGDWAFFVTPYCANGDMDKIIGRNDIGNLKAVDLTCQLLAGLGALHEKRFLHRDLKPANIYIGDDNQSIIGDFGSIKYMPEGVTSIPASSHAVLYRPPESVETNAYGFEGDVYQCGLVLFQLLGGNLPYDEIFWLNKTERRTYDELQTDADKSMYADQCIKSKILRGKIVDLSTLPPWVPENLKRIIRKATKLDPEKRYSSASSFHAHLHNIRPQVPNWVIEDGMPVLKSSPSYKICTEGGQVYAQKSGTGIHWRRDNSLQETSIAGLVAEISKQT